MKTWLYVGGPLILTIGFGFYSGLLDFAHNLDGLEHTAGVEQGGTFALERQETYKCDENGDNCVLVDEKTTLSEIDGLEFEEQAIEYRNGSEDITVRKQPGIKKYTNIVMHRPDGFDWGSMKFIFDQQVSDEKVWPNYRRTNKDVKFTESDTHIEGGVEMIEIDPPVLVIPAQ